ncbi:fatty acid desaturase [Chitinivorax sp. B]|uniref:fatty acid desaturase family protein n=1 Tax=Chitinivorax sp. B TaxID=2502235 RepID=UPI0010F87F50|nr:fatty acid desaturase [Chitinivorax sp. B]
MNIAINVHLSLACYLLLADLLMRLVVYGYYDDEARLLRILKLRPRQPDYHETYYKRWDNWLAPLPFVWTWLDILIGVLLAVWLDHLLAWIALTFWVGGRFRALQEFGHNAVHFALCRHHGWQWWLSDFFYQFPVFKRDMVSRHITHTREHHRFPNHDTKDPNLARVRDGGMAFPMTRSQFLLRLFYPLSLAGIRNNLQTMARNSLLNHNWQTVMYRLISLGLTGTVLYWAGGWLGLVFGWWLPLLTTYAVFAWVSLLTEHRWYASGNPDNRLDIEYLAGRPTDYPGLTGWLVRVFISPTSDAYHLAHSLYPGVRWNYLPAIDVVLKIEEPRYTRHASQGLLWSRDGIPSALSELSERLSLQPDYPTLLPTRSEH